MPSLRKRSRSGKRTTWDIRYYEDGKRKTYTIGETDRRTAEKIYHEFCGKLVAGKLDGTGLTLDQGAGVVETLTLSRLAEASRRYAVNNKSAKTLDREQYVFRNFIAVLGDVPVESINGATLEKYKEVRLKDVSPHTVNIEIRVLNTALNQATQLGQLDASEAKRFKQIRTATPEPPEWLTEEQIDVLLSHKDEWFRRFMLFALHTGCRRNEVLGLEWNDVDLGRRQIVIRGEIGKMGKRRTVPINETLHEVLVKWPHPHDGRLFPMYTPDTISQKFRRWVAKLGLPTGISLHSLRSTFACHLIDKGVDIYTVSRLLGHSSVKVTERHYLALEPDHVSEAVGRLNFGAKDP